MRAPQILSQSGRLWEATFIEGRGRAGRGGEGKGREMGHMERERREDGVTGLYKQNKGKEQNAKKRHPTWLYRLQGHKQVSQRQDIYRPFAWRARGAGLPLRGGGG